MLTWRRSPGSSGTSPVSRLYDRTRDEFTTGRLKLAEYLRYGITAGELRVWYQPQVESSDVKYEMA